MTDNYTEKLNKRALSLLRLSEAMMRDTGNPALESAYKAARAAIYEFDDSPVTQTQLNKMRDAMVKAYEQSMRDSLDGLTTEMYDTAISDANWTYALMLSAMPDLTFSEPVDSKVIRYAKNSMMSMTSSGVKQSFTWSDYVDKYARDSAESVKRAINGIWVQSAIDESQPSRSEYVKAVQAVNSGVNKRNLNTMVRTGINSFSTNGRLAFRDDNLDVIEREIPVVTFDNRTSDICISVAANYGEKGWLVGKSPIGYPPYHPDCRTGVSFIAAGQSIDGTRQAVVAGDKDAFEARKKNLRTKSQVTRRGNNDEALIGKEIAASTPIAKYLRSQPDWFIKDTLGATRGQAFIDGDLDLRTLTTATLKPKTLAELNLEKV
ncbi:hypothetical protein [Vibrio casei]|uniref:hypothetical protein n=1 Tax=Vibrio casei TaxID=673372 RepID=UPI003F9BDD92